MSEDPPGWILARSGLIASEMIKEALAGKGLKPAHAHVVKMLRLPFYNVWAKVNGTEKKFDDTLRMFDNILYEIINKRKTHPPKNELRNIYHPLFDKYGVDLVLNGHNHNYQRTYPVTFNPSKGSEPIVTNQFATGYQGSKDGVVYAIVGTGGEGFHPLLGRQPYVATQFEGKFGFMDVEVSYANPVTKLTGTFYDNLKANVMDNFTIEKEIKGKNPHNVLVQYQQPN